VRGREREENLGELVVDEDALDIEADVASVFVEHVRAQLKRQLLPF
jgi:hypothetical protein